MSEDNNHLKTKVAQLEKELALAKEKNSFSDALFESGGLIVWAVDTELNLISYNENYSRVFRKKNNITPTNEFNSSEVDYLWTPHYKKVLAGSTVNLEIRVEIGDWFEWKEVFLNPVYDTDGIIVAISCVGYDITEKTEAHQKLQSSEEKFRTIFESFQDLYFRTDFKGNLTMLSPSVNEMLGYAETELIGKNVTNYYIYNTKIKSLLRQLIAHGSVRNFDAGLVHKEGYVIPSICNVRLIYKDGKSSYIEGVARNITELKSANEQLKESKELAERSLKIKERFLANMSHEIKTPLNGITGMLHLIDESRLTHSDQNHFKSLKQSSQILMSVLDDLLDLSKIEAGKMSLNNTVVSTAALFEKLQTLYQIEAHTHQLNISFKIHPEVPKYILADEVKLMQVYSNLISNAIKFTPEGGRICTSLKLDKSLKNGNIILKGCVDDTGIGISESGKRKIFKSFTQLDSSTSKSFKGTGLGLYITKKLSELMGGKIGVESHEGGGSEFCFTFETIASAPSGSLRAVDQKINISSEPFILVVDDNNVNLQVASEILMKSGCKVKKASSGKKAIKKAKKYTFDMIFMDIQMPDMDGIETCKEIRKFQDKNKTPIIAMTAYSMKGDRNKYLKAGMDDYVSKPIKPENLIAAVKKWAVEFHSQFNIEEKEIEKNTRKTLNEDVLNNLMKFGGKDMVIETLEEFNKECASQINLSKGFLESTDYDNLLVILHTLKGNAGTLGADKLAYWAEIMEDEVKKKNYHIFEENLKTLETLHKDFVLAVDEF